MSDNLLDTLKHTNLDALFITNVLGFCGDLQKIKDICESKNIILIEDNCEALVQNYPKGKLVILVSALISFCCSPYVNY